jgi:6-phosphogluconate dehydrogenase
VIDASNESHKVTQARQQLLSHYGVAYIGLGVSGGSHGARNGPSLMPGGERWAVEFLLPILTKIAARDEFGRPCVTNIGTGGSGHFVKMIHNGIEHGVMSALCEAWGLMDKNLGMSGDDIADIFDSWGAEGGLVCFRRCYL